MEKVNDTEFARTRDYSSALDDNELFEELRLLKRRYSIAQLPKGQQSNELFRKRICRMFIDAILYLGNHHLQKKLSVNDFQLLAVALQFHLYLRLKKTDLRCDPIDQETWIINNATTKPKGEKRRALYLSEARDYALKLSCWHHLANKEDPNEFIRCDNFLDYIIMLLKEGPSARKGRKKRSRGIRLTTRRGLREIRRPGRIYWGKERDVTEPSTS